MGFKTSREMAAAYRARYPRKPLTSRAERWPNGLGWNFTVGAWTFEIWHHGAVRRFHGGLADRYTPPLGDCPDCPRGALLLVNALRHADIWQTIE